MGKSCFPRGDPVWLVTVLPFLHEHSQVGLDEGTGEEGGCQEKKIACVLCPGPRPKAFCQEEHWPQKTSFSPHLAFPAKGKGSLLLTGRERSGGLGRPDLAYQARFSPSVCLGMFQNKNRSH